MVVVLVLATVAVWASPGASADSGGSSHGPSESSLVESLDGVTNEVPDQVPEDGAAAGQTPALIELPGPLIVEPAPVLAPGPDGHIPHGVDDEMREHIEQLKAVSALVEASNVGMPPQNNYAASYGGIGVTYDSVYSAPSEVRSVIDAAVNQWDSVLATNPSGPIVVEVYWSNLGNSSLLGYAGPDGMFAGGGLPTSSLYPAALANTLLGLDANGAARPEIQVVLNAELLASNRWYLGTTGTPPSSQIDLYSVVLHEVGHGLGFLGSATIPDGQSQPSLYSPPYVYDSVVTHGGAAISDSSNQAAALLSDDVHINISDSLSYKVFAPTSWSQGSSFSHFDESTYPAGTPGALMTPMLGGGETARVLDAPVIGLMAKTGWPTTLQATTPTITSVAPSLTMAVVSWEHNLGQSGLAPDYYAVEAWRDGVTLQSGVTVPGDETSTAIQSLSPGQSYVIKVVAHGQNGYGAEATTSVELEISGGPTDPSEWPIYIRNVPLDGQINRLYQAYFLRLADESGFSYWLDQRASWTSLDDISSAFASSTEFQTRYGQLTDDAFVDLVYANVLNRVAEDEGRDYWIWALSAGVSRGEVMIGFAESDEYVARTGTAAATGVNEARVRRLYEAFFLRAPEADGLEYWTGQADSGVKLEVIASAFAQSAEFQDQYGALGDQQFVELVYANVLGRSPEADGLTYWTSMLQSGLDRGTAMVGFSESAEFVKSTGTIP